MSYPTDVKEENIYKLFLLTFLLTLLTYGFALTNFTVSIDNEAPVFPDFGMSFGRWGQNLIRYQLFEGQLQYFTLLLSLFLFSVAAVRLSKLFKFKGFAAYFFCALFVTFPQISYQVVFIIMADVAAFGVLLSVVSVEIFLKGYETNSLPKKIMYFLAVSLLLMFTLSIYQALVLVPATIYLILFFQSTFDENFKFSTELKKMLVFAGIVILAALLYYLSVKIICPPIENSEYLSSFAAGNSEDAFSNFISLCKTNLKGSAYYGEKLYLLVPVAILFLTINLLVHRKLFIYRFLILFLLIISPFFLSYFITNGYHPPRLYLTSNLVFAFVLIFTLNRFKISSYSGVKIAVLLIAITNIYFVTKLFYTVNKIYKHDVKTAEKIDFTIQTKYPNFSTTEKLVYFYGYFPYEYHQKISLPNSEIFGGSFYNWDNGSNYRIINFFKEADVAEYKMLDTKEQLNVVKDSIAKMPIWPDYGSVKMFDNIVVVKLGNSKGANLYFE